MNSSPSKSVKKPTTIFSTTDGGASPADIAALHSAASGTSPCIYSPCCHNDPPSPNTYIFLDRFLSGQLHVFRPGTDLARVLIAFVPLIGAALIAISRCEDYRHDVYDVTTGSILGFGIALFSYRRYYPRLRALHCDIPFPSRAATADMQGFSKIKIDTGRRGDGAYIIEDPEYDPDAMALMSPDSEHRRDLERGL
jgi:hypothetical protein